MAELVNLRLEKGLAELEEMERVGLFSREEIRKIIKKRKHFEYKLHKISKRKEDFLQYIQYEMNLLLLIRKRRKRLMCESKKKEIDNAIARKINQLFKGARSRFPEDQKLWLDQIKFLKKLKWNDDINVLYTQMLQIHSKIPSLWIAAAKFEMEELSSPENARKLLQRAILHNPKSPHIWREYFRMELMYVDMLHKRREVLRLHNMEENDTEENDAVLDGGIAKIVYDGAVEEIEDVDFALSFLQICLEFEFTSNLVDHILEDVQKQHPYKEETLDALAKRPLLNVQKKIKEGMESGIKKNVILEMLHEEVYSKYDEAVQFMCTEKMWSSYIDFLLSLLSSVKEKKKKKKMKLQVKVMSKMEEAAKNNCLALSYYIQWIDLLLEMNRDDDALLIATSAARKWNDLSLWIKCVTLHIRCHKSTKAVYCLIMEALNGLEGKESLPLWKLAVEWLSIADPEKLIDFFEKGIQKNDEITQTLKEMYLEATALKSGTQAARDLYKRFKKMGSVSLQIIRKIIRIEKGQLKPDVQLLRKYYEDAIRQFGSSDVDIWLEYMKLEVEQEGGNPMLCGMLYWKAMKTLQPELIKNFQTRTTEFATGYNMNAIWDFIPS